MRIVQIDVHGASMFPQRSSNEFGRRLVELVDRDINLKQCLRQTAEEAQIVPVRSTVVVFFQTYNSRVKFDVWWQHYACATYVVIENAVYEEGHVCHNFTDPVRVGTLTQCPLKDIRFLYSLQEIIESVGVRDQARFAEVSTTTVTRTTRVLITT